MHDIVDVSLFKIDREQLFAIYFLCFRINKIEHMAFECALCISQREVICQFFFCPLIFLLSIKMLQLYINMIK